MADTDTFIATEALYIGRARAANPGDEVPAANVEKYGWQDQVARPGTKAATEAADAAAVGETAPAPAPKK